MNEDMKPQKKAGDIAIETEALHNAAEKAFALAAQLVIRLQPILDSGAFGEKGLEDEKAPTMCPLATNLRLDRMTIQEANNKLAELLQYIAL